MEENNSILRAICIVAPCKFDWEKMEGDERARLCTGCDRYVHNISEMTSREAEDFLAANIGKACVKFLRRSDGSVITRESRNWLHETWRLSQPLMRATLATYLVMVSQTKAMAQMVDDSFSGGPQLQLSPAPFNSDLYTNGEIFPKQPSTFSNERRGESIVASHATTSAVLKQHDWSPLDELFYLARVASTSDLIPANFVVTRPASKNVLVETRPLSLIDAAHEEHAQAWMHYCQGLFFDCIRECESAISKYNQSISIDGVKYDGGLVDQVQRECQKAKKLLEQANAQKNKLSDQENAQKSK